MGKLNENRCDVIITWQKKQMVYFFFFLEQSREKMLWEGSFWINQSR
jgi:hypothetical protein